MMPTKEGEKTILVCRSCGAKSADKDGGKIKETSKEETSKVEVIENKDAFETLPKMKVECPKCHNSEAFFWEVQTRASDEPATKFMKCTKCAHIWRDYN
ncbi:MAG TPA: transcription factor S [Candidatus Nanoarchaeia archaeon]|nr:transcription factor S [Candidatus Nanoarchaeia archaeon]